LQILCTLLSLYLIAIFARVILSWFPLQPGSVLAQIFTLVYSITEPVLGPLRRAIPPLGGMLDVSPIIVIIGINLIQSAVLGCNGFLL
jgi:uncharacterized protein YggT (Ycf19 family)